jgi:hypothetical protein
VTAVSTTGDWSAASTTGNWSAASTTGNDSAASTTGYRSAASTTGYRSAASTTGDRSAASTTGDRSAASTTGYRSAASTTGYRSAASTTGNDSAAFAAQGAAESARHVAIGAWVRLGPDSLDALVLPEPGYRPMLVSHQDGWPVGVWITMENGRVVTRPDVLLPDDGRGYRLTHADGRYKAGCRSFTYAEAVAHWSNPDHQVPESAARLLAEVERHHAGQVES